MQGANCSSGLIWGSASCSTALRHAAEEVGDANQRPFLLPELQLVLVKMTKTCVIILLSSKVNAKL